MLRTAAKKVAWVGRTASMVFGLALVMALVMGVATMAFAANGNNFVLGVLNNAATNVTKLTANVAGKPALQVDNTNAAAGSKALQLNVAANKPPLTVNAKAGKATNLNSDKVDGHDAPMWALVKADGSIPSSSDPAILSWQTGDTGVYRISFPRDVSGCAATATIHDINTGEISTSRPPTHLDSITVLTENTGGAAGSVNRRFDLVVNC